MHSISPTDRNAPEVFDFRGNDVRVVLADDGEPRWVAADVAKILGYRMSSDMTRWLEEDEKGTHKVRTSQVNGTFETRSMAVITESGLYAAVLKSRRPEAVDFRRWVTREVLPSIRRHGGYLTDQKVEEALLNPDTIIELAQRLKNERARREALEQQAVADAPKIEAYDTFLDADGTYSVGNVAKMLGLSQNKLFDRLRGAGVLISKGAMRNTPYQKYMHHFAVKAYDYERSNGERATSYTTRVLPSGIGFIQRKLGQPELKAVTA